MKAEQASRRWILNIPALYNMMDRASNESSRVLNLYIYKEGVTSARSGRTPVRAGGVTTFADVSWGPVAVHSGSIFNHVDVLDLVRVVINLLLRLRLFFPDPTQSHMATE